MNKHHKPDQTQLQIGDMLVIGKPSPKLAKALAVIAGTLHQTYATEPWMKDPEHSKISCVLCSLTVADFLRSVGFATAYIRPVTTVMRAFKKGKELHSLGIGAPIDLRPSTAHNWIGHMVVIAGGYIIDTTLYGSIRPAWNHLTGMMAVPLLTEMRTAFGMMALAGEFFRSRKGYEFEIVWCDNPTNMIWQQGPDATDAWKRERTIAALIKAFGTWDD